MTKFGFESTPNSDFSPEFGAHYRACPLGGGWPESQEFSLYYIPVITTSYQIKTNFFRSFLALIFLALVS